MRLTADVLLRAENYLNVYKDRELNLRGLKIPAIENLSVLQDQFDVIDFSDNDIKKLDSFPVMKRLNCLLLNNNSIIRIGKQLGESLPGLRYLILTNNRISQLSEIQSISSCQQLEVLCLLENQIIFRNHYRLFVIHSIPSLKILDYRKITRTERETVKRFFSSEEGMTFLTSIQREKNQIGVENGVMSDGIPSNTMNVSSSKTTGSTNQLLNLTEEQKLEIKKAIEAATTREEIDLIERQLKNGSFQFQ